MHWGWNWIGNWIGGALLAGAWAPPSSASASANSLSSAVVSRGSGGTSGGGGSGVAAAGAGGPGSAGGPEPLSRRVPPSGGALGAYHCFRNGHSFVAKAKKNLIRGYSYHKCKL